MFNLVKLLTLIVFSTCIAENIIAVNPDQVSPKTILVNANKVTISIEGNRSTGYQWLIVDKSDSVHVDSMEYVTEDSSKQKPGAPGFEKIKISFKPEDKWTKGYIILQYTRPWSPDELGEKVTVNFKPNQ